jgi:hypothetical protein
MNFYHVFLATANELSLVLFIAFALALSTRLSGSNSNHARINYWPVRFAFNFGIGTAGLLILLFAQGQDGKLSNYLTLVLLMGGAEYWMTRHWTPTGDDPFGLK